MSVSTSIMPSLHKIKVTGVLLPYLLYCSISSAQFTAQVDSLWELRIEHVKKTRMKNNNILQFTLKEQPRYFNTVIEHMKSLDGDIAEKIVIVRETASPQRDFVFVDEKLYSIYENWGTIENSITASIRQELDRNFGGMTIRTEGNSKICSYANGSTRVFFYIDKIDSKHSKCSVYYYTKRLFSILLVH